MILLQNRTKQAGAEVDAIPMPSSLTAFVAADEWAVELALNGWALRSGGMSETERAVSHTAAGAWTERSEK